MADTKASLDVPEAAPSEPVAKPKASSGKLILTAFVGAILLGAVAFVVTVPLVKGDFKLARSSSSSVVEKSPDNVETTPPGSNNYTIKNTTVGLPFFSESITIGYSSEQEFESALSNAARWIVTGAIQESLANLAYNTATSGGTMNKESEAMPEAAMPGMDMASESAPAGDESASDGDSDFGTNNQEDGVEEADVIKSDGTYVYAAYGDYIIVWDKDGNSVAQVSMPEIPEPKDAKDCDYTYYGEPEVFPVDVATEASDGGNRTRKMSKMIAPCYWWNPKPNVDGLMLVGDHLVAFVSGYGSSLREDAKMTSMPILYEYLNTQIRVYSTAGIAGGNLEFVGKKDIHGRYQDARAVGSNVHISTMASVDTWTGLKAPFYDMKFETEDDRQKAIDKVVPDFVERLSAELSVNGYSNWLQVSVWQTAESADGRLVEDVMGGSVMDNVVHVTSFSLDAELEGEEELAVSSSAFFSPAWSSYMYGTDDMLILTAEAWDWNEDEGDSEQTTYLLGLKMNGPSTEFVSVGSVSGYLLNSYALDIYGNDLRVATTIRRNNWWWGGIVEPMPIDAVLEVMPVDEDVGVADEPAPRQSRPVEESSTENWIIVLNIDSGKDDGKMKLKGKEQIGLDNEVITSVRFFDNVAYAVTFERTDPFYVLDMTVPKAIGELKLNGFSSYLHSMNANNTMMLAVGQDATDEGIATGLMLTVFDATNPSKPKVLKSLTIEEEEDAFSSSSAQWDYKSFRFFNGKLIIPVEIWYYTPWVEDMVVMEDEGTVDVKDESSAGASVSASARKSPGENFRGFKVYDVSVDGISEDFSVDHGTSSCHYCGGYLAPRSLILDGNLMTIRDGSVVSTSLFTDGDKPGKKQWSMNLEIDGESNECCW